MFEKIAQTENVVITRDSHNGKGFYVAYIIDIGTNKFYNAHDAFVWARKELTYCKENDLFPKW